MADFVHRRHHETRGVDNARVVDDDVDGFLSRYNFFGGLFDAVYIVEIKINRGDFYPMFSFDTLYLCAELVTF